MVKSATATGILANLEPSDSLLSFYMTWFTFNHPSGILDEVLAKKKIMFHENLGEILVVKQVLGEMLVAEHVLGKILVVKNVMEVVVVDKEVLNAVLFEEETKHKAKNDNFRVSPLMTDI